MRRAIFGSGTEDSLEIFVKRREFLAGSKNFTKSL